MHSLARSKVLDRELQDPSSGLTYCPIYKSASTTWKNFMAHSAGKSLVKENVRKHNETFRARAGNFVIVSLVCMDCR